jgi:hypothetical protein
MSYSRKIDTFCYDYNFGGAMISKPDSIKDFKLVFDGKMTFDLRSKSMLGFVMRCGKDFSNPEDLRTSRCTGAESRMCSKNFSDSPCVALGGQSF